MIKKLLALTLAVLTVLSLVGCGTDKTGKTEDADGSNVWYLGGNSIMNEVDPETFFEGDKETLNPDKIFDKLDYTADMLYGAYTLNNPEKDVKSIRKDYPMEKVKFSEDSYNMVSLPIAVYAGHENICTTFTRYNYEEFEDLTDINLAVLEFATEDAVGQVICSYEVKGNTVTYTELNQTNTGEEPFAYEVGEAKFTYTFSLKGMYFTLSDGKNEIKLISYSFSEDSEREPQVTGYSLIDSPLLDELDYFSINTFCYAVRRDGSYYDQVALKINDNGRVTVYLSDTVDGEKVVFKKEFAYIAQSEASSFLNTFGIILLDGEKKYYYTDSITQREARITVTEDGADLSEEDLKEIAEKKSDLFDELYDEFEERGIKVTINRVSGEMYLDSSILFGGDSAELTEQGKTFLNEFIEVYTTVVFSEKYEGFVSKTRIEGHTAPVAGSTYESGLPLSQQRADNVKAYCLTAETNVDTSKLTANLEAVGCSNSNPVYNSKGEIDLTASRRVSFKFVVDLKK